MVLFASMVIAIRVQSANIILDIYFSRRWSVGYNIVNGKLSGDKSGFGESGEKFEGGVGLIFCAFLFLGAVAPGRPNQAFGRIYAIIIEGGMHLQRIASATFFSFLLRL